jgi:ABC-type molybdate transport system ATPase subunit
MRKKHLARRQPGRPSFAERSNRRDDMKIRARNVLKGEVVEVTKGATTAHVKIEVGGTIMTPAITMRPWMN